MTLAVLHYMARVAGAASVAHRMELLMRSGSGSVALDGISQVAWRQAVDWIRYILHLKVESNICQIFGNVLDNTFITKCMFSKNRPLG